jgi:hypothetical protein
MKKIVWLLDIPKVMELQFKNPFARMLKVAVATLCVVCMLLCWSCQTKNEAEQITSLKGTKWKLAGIADTGTGTLQELEPKDCKECYTLAFDTDHTATVHSINMVTLKLDLLDLNPSINMDDSMWWEFYDKDDRNYIDGDRFRRGIFSTESYTVISKELKLYYPVGGKKYLLFKPF